MREEKSKSAPKPGKERAHGTEFLQEMLWETPSALPRGMLCVSRVKIQRCNSTTMGKPLGRAEILQQDQNPWSEDQLRSLEEARNIRVWPLHCNIPRNDHAYAYPNALKQSQERKCSSNLFKHPQE